jgi:hypothetical protein
MSPGFHILFSLLRISMDFVEHIRVGQERTETGVGAEEDRPATIFNAWIIGWIGVAKDPSTEGDEAYGFVF